MKISKRWKGILFGVLNIILIGGPLLYLGIYPNLRQNPSSYSESLFFSLLDSNYSTIAQAKEEYEVGNVEVAKITLMLYYQNRANDSIYEIVSYNLTEEMERVDLAIQRIFTHHGKTFQLENYPDSDTVIVNGREIPNTNWHANPYPHDDEWIWQFSRWSWILDFGRAYVGNLALGNITRANYYARECIDLITDFIQKEPVGSAYTWRTLDSALRVSRLLAIGETLRFCPFFTPEFCTFFLRCIADHGRYISDFHKEQYNWAFMESKALLRICSYFPEFLPTNDWENIVWDTITGAIPITFYPDGASREHALNYHVITTSDVRDCLYYATVYPHITPPDSLVDLILNPYLFLLHNTMPDYYGTTFGDTNLKYLKWDIGQGRDLFPTHPEFTCFDSQGNCTGSIPPRLHIDFPDIGVFISRSAWNNTDALFSYFDGGPYGEFYHQHQDFGSVQMYGFGRRLLLDPGMSSYTHDDYSNYFRRSYSHNVLLVDGKQQSQAKPISNHWMAGYLGSVSRAATNDYGKIWEREVTFCDFRENKPLDSLEDTTNSSDLNRYWVVSDFWHGKNNELSLLWHLPNANISKIDTSSTVISEFDTTHNYNIRTDFPNSNIGVYGFGPWNSLDIIQNASLSQYGQPYGTRADRTIMGYWENATTLRYKGSSNTPSSWFTLLYPTPSIPNINVTRLEFTCGDTTYPANLEGNSIGNVFSVTTSQGTDIHISLADHLENNPIQFQIAGSSYSFWGQQCVLHFNSTNHLTQILGGKMDSLTINGTHLISTSNNEIIISESNTLHALTMYTDGVPQIYYGSAYIGDWMYEIENNAISIGPQVLEGRF